MKFRLARHTNRLKQLVDFYVNTIGLYFLGEFKNHSGYDGVFIGKKKIRMVSWIYTDNWDGRSQFDVDDILVFYPDTQFEYNSILDKITNNKVIISIAKNPYWQVNGITIKDPDGHCVVIPNLKIEKSNA